MNDPPCDRWWWDTLHLLEEQMMNPGLGILETRKPKPLGFRICPAKPTGGAGPRKSWIGRVGKRHLFQYSGRSLHLYGQMEAGSSAEGKMGWNKTSRDRNAGRRSLSFGPNRPRWYFNSIQSCPASSRNSGFVDSSPTEKAVSHSSHKAARALAQ